MSARRSLAALGIAVVTGCGLVVAAASPVAASGTGKAVIHLKDGAGNPVSGLKVCPTQHKLPDVGKKEGKCDTTNKHGNATLRAVKAGKWFVTIYSGSTVAGQFPGKIKITAGHTTHKTYTAAG